MKHPIIASAPMADISDSIYGELNRCFGADVIFREMVSSEAIIRGNPKSLRMCEISAKERPVILQIFGCRPEVIAKAALIIKEKFSPDGIDINMGCPMKKIVVNGAGAALMKNKKLATKIVEETKALIKETPLSVKIRLGWKTSDDLIDFVKVIERSGADLLTIHGRTRIQAYGGTVDFSAIAQAVKSVKIPVLANGDIFTAEKAKEVLEITKAAGAMIGRGALGNPWIFKQTKELLQKGKVKTEINERTKIKMLIKHAEDFEKKYGTQSIVQFRKYVGFYLKGFEGARELRSRCLLAKNFIELNERLS